MNTHRRPSGPAPAGPAIERPRSWVGDRLRQARNPPPPVLRAVLANLAVATVGGSLLLLYELALARGMSLPGGDLRSVLPAAYVVGVLVCGSLLTYLWVLLPASATSVARRSPWAAILGFFAALPIAYLALVIVFQVLRPALD